MKVLTVLGTRPEIIRLCRVAALLDEVVDHKLVHTGQNYDYELNEVFFNGLGVRKPDYFLNVDTKSLGSTLGGVLMGAETVLRKERPDAVLILGDTNSAIAAIMAKRLKVPVYHMEAGNRCFDLNVPEEINRRIVDHISDFNLVYTERAREHLLAEGLPHRRIYLTGSPMTEVLRHFEQQIAQSKALAELSLQPRRYLLASLHREENVDNSAHLLALLKALEAVSTEFDCPVVISTHPRTRNRMSKLTGYTPSSRLIFLKPFGFFDYVHLQQQALCVLSDSGTISEESAILGFPAVTVRTAMERPEALDAGSIILTGREKEVIVAAMRMQIGRIAEARSIPPEYLVNDCSRRVVGLILGTARLSNQWEGIIPNDLG